MPAALCADTDLRADLADAVALALKLTAKLEKLTATRSRAGGEGFHGKTSHSPAPWNAEVANAVMDLHALARDLERQLLAERGLPQRARGGSAENTREALEALPGLASHADDWSVRFVARKLGGWNRRAKTVMGETEMPRRLPQAPGAAAPRCPWCKRDSLREEPLKGRVFCLDVTCHDEDGRRPEAFLELFRGEFVLRWMDGVIGVPA